MLQLTQDSSPFSWSLPLHHFVEAWGWGQDKSIRKESKLNTEKGGHTDQGVEAYECEGWEIGGRVTKIQATLDDE